MGYFYITSHEGGDGSEGHSSGGESLGTRDLVFSALGLLIFGESFSFAVLTVPFVAEGFGIGIFDVSAEVLFLFTVTFFILSIIIITGLLIVSIFVVSAIIVWDIGTTTACTLSN